MNIKQLHYFYELAQHRHFAKAAKACFITQPTLSASITALEKSLGTELVVRNSQFVALTQAGEVVLRHAERMLLEQDAMRQELSLFGGALSGTLRIGVVPQSSIDIMPLLSHAQIFTFLVFLTFYVPCLSTFAVMLKTLGRKEAWFSVFVSLASALLMAGIVRAALELTQHFIGFGA